jgi:hypothetical protein
MTWTARMIGVSRRAPFARKIFLHVHNFRPECWPTGIPETDFGICGPSPTKELLKLLAGLAPSWQGGSFTQESVKKFFVTEVTIVSGILALLRDRFSCAGTD